MKIGVVADVHYGPDADTQLGRNAALLLDTFCEAMGTFRPDLIVDLGDRVVSIAGRHVDIRIAGLQPQHWRFAP